MYARLVTWGLVLALALGVAVLGRLAWIEGNRADDAEKALATLRTQHRAIVADVQRLEETRGVSRKELSDVLEKNKDWADGPVPSPVAGVLCKRLRCF